MLCLIPPKLSVSEFMFFLKDKLAMKLFKDYPSNTCLDTDCDFWSRGYFVSTVGLGEEMIKRYVEHQEEQEE